MESFVILNAQHFKVSYISLLTIWLNCKLRTNFLKSIHSAIQLRVSLAIPLNLKVCYKCRKGCIVGATCGLSVLIGIHWRYPEDTLSRCQVIHPNTASHSMENI